MKFIVPAHISPDNRDQYDRALVSKSPSAGSGQSCRRLWVAILETESSFN
jgi:hypothetical protein